MNKIEVVIIDYGISNILSVQQGFEKIGAHAIVTTNIQEINQAKLLVLPGVGAFQKAMQALHNLNLVDTINHIDYYTKLIIFFISGIILYSLPIPGAILIIINNSIFGFIGFFISDPIF